MDGWMKMHSYKCKNKYIIRDHKLEKQGGHEKNWRDWERNYINVLVI